MNIRFKISTGKFFTSFSDSKLKELDKLQKSVNSLNEGLSDLSSKLQESNKQFLFSLAEINAAIKRVEKNDNRFYPLANTKIDKHVEYESHCSLRYIDDNESFIISLLKTIFGFVVPGVYCEDSCAHYKTGAGWTEIHMSEDLKAEVLAELYYRRLTRILSNILSKFFEFWNLITAESPIRIIRYKYFDLVFSLKKEVALKTMLIIHFFNQLFYCREYETKYFRNIQVAGRT